MIRMDNLSKIMVLLVLALSSCKEFIEPSISDEKVVLLAPSNGTETVDYEQTFWWEEVEDALTYRLQVVSPDFNNSAKLVLDTVVNISRFSFTLDPGTYQWRVRAANGSSQTAYASSGFVVHATSITEQQPHLQFPATNLVTGTASTVFSWLSLYGAEEYRLQIDTNNFADETVLFYDKVTPSLQSTVSLTRDKLYQWRVKGLNGADESKWSPVRNITFDSTPPAKVVLAAPANGVMVSSPVTLRWNAVTAALKYELYVYSNEQGTAYNSTYPLILTTTSHAFTGLLGETVYWQVRAIDGVGNLGALSDVRSFKIQ